MVTNEFIRIVEPILWEISEGMKIHVDTWVDLKREMRTRFVLVSYTRNLYNKLQRIVKEYHRYVEVALSGANVLESSKAIMARFLHWLNQDIHNMVELTRYSTMDDLEEEKLPNPIPASKSNSIKCFKCLGKGHIALHCHNKRSMVMKEDGIVDSGSSISESSSKSESNASCEYSPDKERDSWVVRCLMKSGSSVNVASARLVEKLKVPTLAHPNQYKLQWLSSEGEIVVEK
ncbi:hypothetical protein CR513_15391, partial [Mucuna pruriens]